MNAQSLPAEELFSSAEAELLWPQSKRTIYCSVSGRPWGTVREDYIRDCIACFGPSRRDELEKMIERMTLFSGPSPLWQNKVSNMLVQNKLLDPQGFTVYMINYIFKFEPRKADGLEEHIKWRRDMVWLYSALENIDSVFLNSVNDTLLMLSGEGMLPPRYSMPGQSLRDYASKKMLERLIRHCRQYYEEKKRNIQYTGTLMKKRQMKRHLIHQRASYAQLNADRFDAKTQQNMIELMLTNLFASIDTKYSKSQTKRAKTVTGIASPVFMELNRIVEEQKTKAPKAQSKPIGATLKPGEKITIRFAGKNNEN